MDHWNATSLFLHILAGKKVKKETEFHVYNLLKNSFLRLRLATNIVR